MTIKFVSLNLWFGGELFDEIVAFLKAQDADIVVLQEAFSSTDVAVERQYRSMQVLSEKLGYAYTDFAPAYRDFDHTDGKAQRGNGILSKFSITGQDNIFFFGEYTETYRDVPGQFKNCPRNLQHVQLDTPAGEMHVYNIQGVWDLDGDSYSKQRRQMSDIIIEQVDGKPNVILAGDTNAKMTNRSILDIEKHTLRTYLAGS